jgi:hypothetical protein
MPNLLHFKPNSLIHSPVQSTQITRKFKKLPFLQVVDCVSLSHTLTFPCKEILLSENYYTARDASVRQVYVTVLPLFNLGIRSLRRKSFFLPIKLVVHIPLRLTVGISDNDFNETRLERKSAVLQSIKKSILRKVYFIIHFQMQDLYCQSI